MAKKAENRCLNVSVVSLSGTEKDKGVVGVGKSCLCNRFMRPLADNYYTDHISVLSQSDFSGRVVNNDHFLYWGEVTKTTDEGMDFTFHVVEQTEFIDDSSFLPFKSGKTEPYFKRCAATKIQSAEKLMYICKNQLGLEHEFDQKILPDGKLSIDGFICCFDVSMVQQRPIERQVDYTAHILNNLMKTKKPIVLVTTKNDEANDHYLKEAEKLVGRREFKGSIPIVECSSHENINVELAFITLAHLIDKNFKGRTRIVPFGEAARARKEVLDVATDAYQHLIRSQVTDHRSVWMGYYRIFQQNADFNHYVDLFGTDSAKKLFRRYVRQLRNDHVNRREQLCLDSLKNVFHDLLPDMTTIADRSWPSCIRYLRRHEDFDTYFIEIPDEIGWKDSEYVDGNDQRIPFDLLTSAEAETLFRNHVNALQAEQKRLEMRKQFKQLLEDNVHVTPGKQLSEVSIFFLGRECYSVLSDNEKQEVFDQHQKEIRDRAKRDFVEMLLEHADVFARFDPHGTITTEDLQEINDIIKEQPRYKALGKLEEDRKVMILNHLGFIQCPSRERCPFRDHCMEHLIQRSLSTRAHRPQSWHRQSQWQLDTEDSRVNLVILGNYGLADEMVLEIRSQCIDDDYTSEGAIYNLDYRPIDGDVSLPSNSFRTPDFLPHGCFCVYSTQESFEYIRDSLEKTLLADLEMEDRLPFQGLPIVIMLALENAQTEKGLMLLREQGQQLADRLQCPFIDIPNQAYFEENKRFHQTQVTTAMFSLLSSIKHRAGFINPFQIAEAIEPDIRIAMCMMCGDDYSVDLPLGPLLSHQCCYVGTIDKYQTITLETYLDEQKRKVEVTVSSYHDANQFKDELFHGYILIYSAKRKASLATLIAFAQTMMSTPLQIIAATESGGANAFFSNEHSQVLITEGNAAADRFGARFMTTSTHFQQQTATYTPFFKECWDRRGDTESAFSSDDHELIRLEPHERHYSGGIDRRPPAVLPKPPRRIDSYGITTKGSTSNSQSTEDSEPVYEMPRDHCQSDSEGEEHDHRASSASPTFYEPGPYSTINDPDVYSDIPPTMRTSEHLIKPSQVHKSMYAEHYRRSYPSAHHPLKKELEELHFHVDSQPSTPKLERASTLDPPESDNQPRYQFRKSKSMKLALQEEDEGWAIYEGQPGKRTLHKASTLPAVGPRHGGGGGHSQPTSSQDEGWVDESERSRSDHHGDWLDQPCSHKTPPPTKPKPPIKPKPLNMSNYLNVTKVIKRNLSHHNNKQPKALSPNLIQAPLATMEPIEIGDYAQVKDAVSPQDNDYALVQDALPAGKLHRIKSTFTKQQDSKGGSDSESEFSSLERKKDNIYTKVQRKPTPHKKKHKHKSTDETPPHHHTDRLHVHVDHLEKVRSNSPSEGSEGTGDELQNPQKQKKRRSFKRGKKKSSSQERLIISPPFSDNDPLASPNKMTTSLDEEGIYEQVTPTQLSPRYGEDGEELGDGSVWRRKWRLKSDKDPDKMRKKEEKKAKEDERRRLKEEEKRVKEQQKQQRKMKKKDSKQQSTSQSGNVLEDYIHSEQRLIPLFVEKCIKYIEKEGLQTEGIYRVPGNRAHVDLLVEKLKQDPETDIDELDIPVNAVATALKGFFSDLTEPLIPSYLYEELIEAAETTKETEGIRDKSSRILALRGVLKKLPAVNFEVLRYLMTHIDKVTKEADVNAMSSKNLAICWWPTLLQPEFQSFEKMTMVSKLLEEIVQTLIDQHGFFFYGEDEV